MADIKAIVSGRARQRYSKYQWPADKITEREMTILHKWRNLTGTPINHLLGQAVQELNKIINR